MSKEANELKLEVCNKLTVGKLRKILEGLDEDCTISIATIENAVYQFHPVGKIMYFKESPTVEEFTNENGWTKHLDFDTPAVTLYPQEY